MKMKGLSFLLLLAVIMAFQVATQGQVGSQKKDEAIPPYPLGGPIPIFYAHGKAHERGIQLGKQLYAFSPDLLKDSVEGSIQFLQLRSLQGRYPDREELKRRFLVFLAAARKRMRPEVVDEFLEEMRGIAEGAKINPTELMLAKWGSQFANWDKTASSSEEAVPAEQDKEQKPDHHCSSMAAWGEATVDGRMLASHNCDGMRFVAQIMPPVATVLAPEKGNVLVYAGISGTLGGHHIVSPRIFVNGTALPPPKEMEPNLCVIGGPHGILRRWLCQYSESAAEAKSKLQAMGGMGDQGIFPPSTTLNLVDSKNAIYLLCAGRHIGVLPNQNESNCVANHFCLDSLEEWFDDEAEKKSPFYLQMRESSTSRRQAINHHIQENYGKLDIEILKNIMTSHYDVKAGKINQKGHTICQHGEARGRPGGTVMSTLVDFKAQKVYLALGNPCGHGYTEILIPSKVEVEGYVKQRMAQIASGEKIDFFTPLGKK